MNVSRITLKKGVRECGGILLCTYRQVDNHLTPYTSPTLSWIPLLFWMIAMIFCLFGVFFVLFWLVVCSCLFLFGLVWFCIVLFRAFRRGQHFVLAISGRSVHLSGLPGYLTSNHQFLRKWPSTTPTWFLNHWWKTNDH